MCVRLCVVLILHVTCKSIANLLPSNRSYVSIGDRMDGLVGAKKLLVTFVVFAFISCLLE